MKRYLLLFLSLAAGIMAYAQHKTENVVLITLDGFRWQELFGGAVDSLMNDTEYVKDTAGLLARFDAPTMEARRNKLMPWFWSHIGKDGQIYGNRWHGNEVTCSNIHWFSYPGYNEILTGYSDPYVDSNEKKYNKNVTVLEWLNQMEPFHGKVAAFGSWDVFPYIINDTRSGVPVNTGPEHADPMDPTVKEQMLNAMQSEVPLLFGGMRMDVFTHHLAMEYFKKHHPRVMYIAYGETDDFAHAGRYDNYLSSANQTDTWIGEIWDFLQSDPVYRDKTTVLITTDHGRGSSPKEEWKSHGKVFKGSPGIWFAVMGPDTPAKGEVLTSGRYFQNQMAATVAKFLGYDFVSEHEIGAPVDAMMTNVDAGKR